eukprot:6858562-Lingulodinium_polyedra.AAC.1
MRATPASSYVAIGRGRDGCQGAQGVRGLLSQARRRNLLGLRLFRSLSAVTEACLGAAALPRWANAACRWSTA